MPKTAPSLRDVAQAAGVSLGTASRALNNKSNVLPSTRALVLKAATDLGYKLQFRMPTTVASRLNTVGVVVKRDPSEYPGIDPFNYAILCGVEDECERLSINMMYASLPVDEISSAKTWSPMLENEQIDGLVVIGVVFEKPELVARIPKEIPVVLVDSYAYGADYDSVLIQNERGAYNAVRYLIQQGHRDIGLIGSGIHGRAHPGILERHQGYLKALADHEIQRTYVEDSYLHHEQAYHAAYNLLKRCPEVTAIFSCNDDIAPTIVQAVTDLKRHVPKDVSIMGFDDSVVALKTQPLLSTVHVDKELMGALAVRQLYERSANSERPPITTLVGTCLIERESVAKNESRVGVLEETKGAAI
jgi:LacI family transcriptional regulator